jgi:outer membrane protein assembly factor BamB
MYIASWGGGSVYAVDANTGQQVWQALDGLGFSSSPVIAAGRLYITADDGNLYALDAVTGATLWSQLIYANSASAAVAMGLSISAGVGPGTSMRSMLLMASPLGNSRFQAA